VVFGKEYIMRCTSAEWFARFECLEMMPSWCRPVNWGNCGIPRVNCSVFCVKDDWKGQFWGLRNCPENCVVYSVFSSGMTSHSKIAQFNWECTGRFRGVMLLKEQHVILFTFSFAEWMHGCCDGTDDGRVSVLVVCVGRVGYKNLNCSSAHVLVAACNIFVMPCDMLLG